MSEGRSHQLNKEMPLHDAWDAAWEAARATADLGPLPPDTPGPAPLPAGFWERLAAVEAKSYEQLQGGAENRPAAGQT